MDQKSHWAKIKMLAGLPTSFFLEVLGENTFPYLFQITKAICIPWLVAPSSIFKASKVASSNLSCDCCFITSPSLMLTLFPSSYKNANYAGLP